MRRIIATAAFVIVLSTAAPVAAIGLDFSIAGGFQLKGDVADLNLDTDSGFNLGGTIDYSNSAARLVFSF